MRNQSMGVGKSMKIFMEGMQNSMMSSGYTGKIVNTPMGPFSWNDTTNSWVNQNNGFSIPNISLQELMMVDYSVAGDYTSIGSGGSLEPLPDPSCVYTITGLSNESIGRLGSGTQYLFTNKTLATLTCPCQIYLQNISGGTNADLYYSLDGGVTKPKWAWIGGSTSPLLTVSAGNFRLYGDKAAVTSDGIHQFSINNASDSNAVLATYQFEIDDAELGEGGPL